MRQLTPPAAPTSRYHLHIRQQPSAARACGSGDKDRRDIDPPPVLQLLVTDLNEEDHEDMEYSQFVMYCRLYSTEADEKDRVNVSDAVDTITVVSEETGEEVAHQRHMQRLTGRTITNSFFVKEDPDPSTAPQHPRSAMNRGSDHFARIMNPPPPPPAVFFVFNDMSVRTPGRYRLFFEVMRLGDLAEPGALAPSLATAWTNEFQVYAAKDFPGMMQSSVLMKQLKALGMSSIRLRDKGRVEKKEPDPESEAGPSRRTQHLSRRIWEE